MTSCFQLDLQDCVIRAGFAVLLPGLSCRSGGAHQTVLTWGEDGGCGSFLRDHIRCGPMRQLEFRVTGRSLEVIQLRSSARTVPSAATSTEPNSLSLASNASVVNPRSGAGAATRRASDQKM
ncbi:hypothetical protein [Nitrosomonas sp. Nm33]|uniref:hypothetical protein n=1 Tax=Nitrosomonas sp. Nm33 TaxID=133724 RepID=UPI00159FD0C7|nr:hypothetical protein [Nitrosomonas sp. Nm33]